MLSHDKILFHMLFGAFPVTPCTLNIHFKTQYMNYKERKCVEEKESKLNWQEIHNAKEKGLSFFYFQSQGSTVHNRTVRGFLISKWPFLNQIFNSNFRSRSISPETYRKYGSRTPSPRRKSRRSRSRSPIVRKSKPLKPNKPKVKNQKSEESESSSSSSSEEEMTPPSSPKVEKK